ncbi:MAG: hypothetical protein ACXWYV_00565 [Solirubrobacterales bacterium]
MESGNPPKRGILRGGLFFTTGAYASMLGAINGPRSVGAGWTLTARPWRWWSYEPERIDWLAPFTLFAGTLAFGISLIDSFLRRRDLGWSIVAINQIGSILFMISALAAFTRPETSSDVNVAVANWGTLTGALCFAIGGVMQAFDRPADRGTEVNRCDRGAS